MTGWKMFLRRYWFPVASFASGLAFHTTYNAIGSYVADDGTLVEPFALIPIGFLFYAVAVLSAVVAAVLHWIDRRQISKYRSASGQSARRMPWIELGLFSFAVGVFLYWVVVD